MPPPDPTLSLCAAMQLHVRRCLHKMKRLAEESLLGTIQIKSDYVMSLMAIPALSDA